MDLNINLLSVKTALIRKINQNHLIENA